MSAEVWTDLEREYSPSSMVTSLSALTDRYRFDSERVRRLFPPRTYAFGAHPDETLDVFPACPGSPVHVFVHGGYWQEHGKDDSSFPAEGFRAQGVAYVAINYTLAPALSLDGIVDQTVRALAWIRAHAAELGIDRSRLVVSGSSAGAHLVSAAVLRMMAAPAAPAPVAGLVLLSGVYALRPLVETYINDALGLDAESAERLSPLSMLTARSPDAAPLPPLIACWGEHETDTFKRQSAEFAGAWRAHGATVITAEIAGRNHFDIVHDLADPTTELGALVHSQTSQTRELPCP